MSEELKAAQARIACLEGEIAKRDERIVELQNDASYYAARNEELRAKLAAPVSDAKARGVVMPERDAVIRKAVGMCNRIPGSTTWNAAEFAYDELAARLAAAPAAPAADAGASLIEWTKDAVEWGGALNYAAWEFVNECPEKSALLFNNTKGPLRAAIMKYAEIVSAHRAKGVV